MEELATFSGRGYRRAGAVTDAAAGTQDRASPLHWRERRSSGGQTNPQHEVNFSFSGRHETDPQVQFLVNRLIIFHPLSDLLFTFHLRLLFAFRRFYYFHIFIFSGQTRAGA